MKLKCVLYCGAGGLLGLLAILALVIGFVVWTEYPFGWKSPRDQELIDTFRTHREALENLRALAVQDGEWRLSEATLRESKLSDPQQSDCRRLLREIWPGMSVGVDYDHSVRFVFASGGVGLSIGPGWVKGITYIPGDYTRDGVLSPDLNKLTKAPDNVYLRQLEPHWFLFYQRDDYDSPNAH